jgi:aminoglycoside phosphotransferase (APT) family kinase protein
MHERCEVCENLRPQGDLRPNRPLETVWFGQRSVRLCRAHAGIARNSGVTSFEELRELYSESHGRRSYVPRRSRAAAGAARESGRRASDRTR